MSDDSLNRSAGGRLGALTEAGLWLWLTRWMRAGTVFLAVLSLMQRAG